MGAIGLVRLLASLILAVITIVWSLRFLRLTSIGELVDLTQLTRSLPDGFLSVDHAVSSGGLLFLASEEKVIVWTPWGWDILWRFSREHEIDRIRAIACARAPSGERLLIATTRGLWQARWERRKPPATIWGKAELTFHVEPIGGWSSDSYLEGMVVNPYKLNQDGGAIGYVHDEPGRLRAISDKGDLQLGRVEPEPIGNQVAFTLSGYALAWPYRGKMVTILSPTAAVLEKIDVERVMAGVDGERKHLFVTCAWVDEARGLWFLGTSHGTAVGGLDGTSRRPLSELRRVERLGTASPLAIGQFLGRVLLVVDFDGKGNEGTILIEDGIGMGPDVPSTFAANASFTHVARADQMGPPSRAAILGPDVVWAVAAGGVWEWTPAGWRHLDADVDVPRAHETGSRPIILSDLLRKRLWCLRPRASDGFRESSMAMAPFHVGVSDTCPDPSGGGVWLWDQMASPPDMDYVRFATPHAVLDNRPATSHPAGFRVARVTHRDAGGKIYTPKVRGGALLLPTGADFLLGRGGYWTETDRSALDGSQFVELTTWR